ncbi:hypothetical protein FRC00_007835 [Tulasnella sp. 408]|nr:hypothetical protein FRC00_007835 [Tulasnella sp. 408]
MEFLLTVFPRSSPATLQRVLEDYGDEESGDVDMEKVIEEIMSLELVRELEERGLELEMANDQVDEERKRDWSSVEKKKVPKRKKAKSVSTTTSDRGSAQTSKTFVLSDIRQQANRQSSKPPGIATQGTLNDPWTKVASLSARLAQLLPPLTSSHFSSLLHNPAFSSPAEAIRQELARIGDQDKDPPENKFNTVLAGFLELLECRDGAEMRDAVVCLKASKLMVERALDLVYLLQDLDAGEPIVAHSPFSTPSSPISTQASSSSDLTRAIVTPLPLSPVSSLRSPAFGSSTNWPKTPSHRSQTEDWTKVTHERKRNANKDFEVDPLAAFIPAYAGRPAGWRSKSGRAAWEPDISDETSEKDCREMAAYYRKRREETLRQASRYWKGNGGGTRNGVNVGRGGEVALYYAEEAREFERKSREWSMKAAKALVNSRQAKTNDPNSIDLHGTNTQEALTIAREAVHDWWSKYGSEAYTEGSVSIETGITGMDDRKSDPFTVSAGGLMEILFMELSGFVSFRGQDGNEAEEFIQAVRRAAFNANKDRDDEWMARFASTCMSGKALRWYESLDDDVQDSWKRLRKAILARYPPADEYSIVPSVSAAPAAAAAPPPAAAPWPSSFPQVDFAPIAAAPPTPPPKPRSKPFDGSSGIIEVPVHRLDIGKLNRLYLVQKALFLILPGGSYAAAVFTQGNDGWGSSVNSGFYEGSSEATIWEIASDGKVTATSEALSLLDRTGKPLAIYVYAETDQLNLFPDFAAYVYARGVADKWDQVNLIFKSD